MDYWEVMVEGGVRSDYLLPDLLSLPGISHRQSGNKSAVLPNLQTKKYIPHIPQGQAALTQEIPACSVGPNMQQMSSSSQKNQQQRGHGETVVQPKRREMEPTDVYCEETITQNSTLMKIVFSTCFCGIFLMM